MEFDLSTLQPKERASFALRALYEAAGCRKYHMGRFEEYSLYQANRSFLSSEQVITFTDLDGRLLALKPDVTLSIAKTAQPAPGETLRYYYHENVYRPSAESHTFKEIGQMGLEFLGGVGEAEVQQAVCLAAQSLGQLGTDWVLEVSHMGYLFGLLDALQVPEDARAGLLRKLGQKNAHELRAAALAAGLDEDAADTLCRVLTLCGGYADTLPRAEALCRNDAMRAAVAELQGLAGPLEQAGGAIRLDLTLAGEMEYYNGLVFQGYLKALPRPLLKGGRYDLLMQQFTPGAGAIGFAVYLDELDRLSAPLPPVQKNSTDKVMLNVALPKGRLGDKVYNLLAGILRSLGDSKTPVVFLALSSFLNIFLDFALILWFDAGVAGAAIATVVSQGISGVACLCYMAKKYPILRMSREERRLDVHSCRVLCAMLAFAPQCAMLFLDPGEEQLALLVRLTAQYITTLAAFFFPLALVNILRFSIQGMGYSMFAILAGVLEMLARTAVGSIFVPLFGYTAACFASPAAWLCADLFLLPACIHCIRRLRKLFPATA